MNFIESSESFSFQTPLPEPYYKQAESLTKTDILTLKKMYGCSTSKYPNTIFLKCLDFSVSFFCLDNICQNTHASDFSCDEWLKGGDCKNHNSYWMRKNCQKACATCWFSCLISDWTDHMTMKYQANNVFSYFFIFFCSWNLFHGYPNKWIWNNKSKGTIEHWNSKSLKMLLTYSFAFERDFLFILDLVINFIWQAWTLNLFVEILLLLVKYELIQVLSNQTLNHFWFWLIQFFKKRTGF